MTHITSLLCLLTILHHLEIERVPLPPDEETTNRASFVKSSKATMCPLPENRITQSMDVVTVKLYEKKYEDLLLKYEQ